VANLHRSLLRHQFNAIALHGDMDQPARMAALDRFRRGEVELLIASDVAARGLDIPEVSHVFNFDVPHHPDDYVHRIGRTGRAGRTGTAITIVAPVDRKSIGAIERLIGQTIPWMGGAALSEPREFRPAQKGHRPARAELHNRHSHRKPARRGKKELPAQIRPLSQAEENESGHLPAFLLRPVSVKS
jgi:superfamily II DNA/RNA helicase